MSGISGNLGAVALLGGLVALAGLWVFTTGAKAGRAAQRQIQHMVQTWAVLGTAGVSGAVIVAVQWMVITGTPSTAALLVALAVPALLAGITVARMAAVVTVSHGSHRGRRRSR